MSKYMADGALKDASLDGHPPEYDLYATVNHFGSVFFGHYMAYVRPNENEGELCVFMCVCLSVFKRVNYGCV